MSAGYGRFTARLGKENRIANRSASYIDWSLEGLGRSAADQENFFLCDAKAEARASALQEIVQTADSIVKMGGCDLGNNPYKAGALKKGLATETLAVVLDSTSRRPTKRNAVRTIVSAPQ